MYEKFYVHEIAGLDLSKIHSLKNAKKTCKPNNRDLNRDWAISFNILSFQARETEDVGSNKTLDSEPQIVKKVVESVKEVFN